MSQIYRELIALIEAGAPCALATLVSASGSSPQNAGAKVIFLPDGRIVGTIGGGCMEAEAQRAALDSLRTGKCRLFELRLDGDYGFDDGLICGGQVTIFINPHPERSTAAYNSAIGAFERRELAALAVLVKGNEERLGDTLFLRPERHDTIPHELGDAVRAALEAGRERVADSGDGSWYAEPIFPRPTVVIAGAGHIGAALGSIVAQCGFQVIIVDDRPSYANARRLPFADRVVVADIPGFLRDLPKDEETYIVIVTRGHRHDGRSLRECVGSNAKYVGMIGSRRKICVIYEELLREGAATPEELRRVHSPIGLSIGAKEVGEIAVSIASEIVAVRRGADLGGIMPMRYLPPILAATSQGPERDGQRK